VVHNFTFYSNLLSRDCFTYSSFDPRANDSFPAAMNQVGMH